ncbi:MAG: ABC transporter permease, partial [Lachnospiraceae bacterium]|nr:ABC transporter permease [Lachnospiraceae bacterium]
PEDFIRSASQYDLSSGAKAPEVQVYYNSASTESVEAYQTITDYLDQYENSLANQFDINADEKGEYDLATKEDITADIFSSMVPFLLLIFLYSGCIAVAPESIAGEKEKGTMAALLITPVKRSHIALGKIAALSLIAVLSGASSALGTLLSLPKLMTSDHPGFDQGVYQFSDYGMLAGVIISTALVLVTLISLVSAFARTLKEAQTYVTPLMILVMLIGVTAMFGKDAKTAIGYYCIPVYNSVQSMVGIFSFQSGSIYILTTIAVNLLATGVGAVILAKMFDSEYIMFHK